MYCPLQCLCLHVASYSARIDHSPPIVAVYVLGICWRRANAHGAIAAVAVGFALGFARVAGQIGCKLFPPPTGSLAHTLFLDLNYVRLRVAPRPPPPLLAQRACEGCRGAAGA